MKKNKNTPFEVTFQERIQQRLHSKNSYRLGKLGYKLYRITENKQDAKPSDPGGYTRTTQFVKISKIRNGTPVGYTVWYVSDECQSSKKPKYDVAWLTPKHITYLRMKGFTVEEAQPSDRSNKVGP